MNNQSNAPVHTHLHMGCVVGALVLLCVSVQVFFATPVPAVCLFIMGYVAYCYWLGWFKYHLASMPIYVLVCLALSVVGRFTTVGLCLIVGIGIFYGYQLKRRNTPQLLTVADIQAIADKSALPQVVLARKEYHSYSLWVMLIFVPSLWFGLLVLFNWLQPLWREGGIVSLVQGLLSLFLLGMAVLCLLVLKNADNTGEVGVSNTRLTFTPASLYLQQFDTQITLHWQQVIDVFVKRGVGELAGWYLVIVYRDAAGTVQEYHYYLTSWRYTPQQIETMVWAYWLKAMGRAIPLIR